MIKLLLIDDNVELCQALRGQCQKDKKYDLDYVNDLQSGINKFKENPSSFDAVILDGRGQLTKENQQTTDNHVIRGILSLREISKDLPLAIYTGFIDIVEDRLESIPGEKIPIFKKASEFPNELFDYLQDAVENNEYYKVKRKYSQLISLFDDGLLYDDGKIFSAFKELLIRYERDEFASLTEMDRYGAYNTIRATLEAIYKTINDQFPATIPDSFFVSGKWKFNSLKKHLSGNSVKDAHTGKFGPSTKVFQSQDIEYLTQCVYWNPGSQNHFNQQRVGALTNYAIISNMYALFEIMLWYKNGIETNLFD